MLNGEIAYSEWHDLKAERPEPYGFYLVFTTDSQINVAFWSGSRFTGSVAPYVTHWAELIDPNGSIYR